jgi:hypothetical protein
VAADRVADIFHLRDSATEERIEDETRIATLSQALQDALIFVSASDNHIYELYFDETKPWQARDLTDVAVPKATMYSDGSQLSGYQTMWNSSQHVNFIDTNGHISKLYRMK